MYRKEIYDARTRDGWVLQISRYRPVPQPREQPILGEPLLLVPGWSQNRHAFTCATFVKRLLVYGADCHVLELRGHGRSSRELQRELCAKESRPLDGNSLWGARINLPRRFRSGCFHPLGVRRHSPAFIRLRSPLKPRPATLPINPPA